jgi:hypothetical protein
MPRNVLLVPLLFGFGALAGCSNGRPVARVSGVVTYGGKPVPHGTVLFMPADSGPPAYGNLDADGHYTLSTYSHGDGAVLGKHSVRITAREPLTPEMLNNAAITPKQLVPSKYGDPRTSNLTAEVEKRDNQIDFTLK